MTLIISKKVLDGLNPCSEGATGLDWLLNDVSNGDPNFEITVDDLLSKIRSVDKPSEEKTLWYLYIKDLKENLSLYEQQGAVIMLEKYQVFNTLTGQYEIATSIDDARAIQQRIKDEFMAANSGLFVINQEAYIPDEDKSLWKIVE